MVQVIYIVKTKIWEKEFCDELNELLESEITGDRIKNVRMPLNLRKAVQLAAFSNLKKLCRVT